MNTRRSDIYSAVRRFKGLDKMEICVLVRYQTRTLESTPFKLITFIMLPSAGLRQNPGGDAGSNQEASTTSTTSKVATTTASKVSSGVTVIVRFPSGAKG